MSLYAIGDTHLSLGADKPMDIFGGGWAGYVEKLREGFSQIGPEDTVVLCGDLSWGMSLEQAREDFAFLDALPGGRKILLKGNHDYWWTTAAKMERFFAENGFSTLEILHNNCRLYGEVALCGTRGWFYEEERGEHSTKIFNQGGGGAGEVLLSPLPAPVPGVPLPGDPGPAGAVPGEPVLLRPSPRGKPPPGLLRKAGDGGVPPGGGRLYRLPAEKNLRLAKNSWEKTKFGLVKPACIW